VIQAPGVVRAGESPLLRQRPGAEALPDYYHAYLDRLGDDTGPVLPALVEQGEGVLARFQTLGAEQASHRYAPEKWTVREVLGHVMDTERVFQLRALWFARGDETPQPGFDENAWARVSSVDQVAVPELLREYASVRNATVSLFANLDEVALARTGTGSGRSFQVAALAWFLLAHERHHLVLLDERYGV
jgi:hypothetical protein